MKNLLTEFRAFAVRGNVIDLAVAVIIGAAFAKIIESLVGDLVMPILSLLLGGRLDFTNLYVALGPVPVGVADTYEALKAAGVPLLAYGRFISIVINFLMMALAIFMMIRLISRWKEQFNPPARPSGPTPSEVLLAEIRDLLKTFGGAVPPPLVVFERQQGG